MGTKVKKSKVQDTKRPLKAITSSPVIPKSGYPVVTAPPAVPVQKPIPPVAVMPVLPPKPIQAAPVRPAPVIPSKPIPPLVNPVPVAKVPLPPPRPVRKVLALKVGAVVKFKLPEKYQTEEASPIAEGTVLTVEDMPHRVNGQQLPRVRVRAPDAKGTVRTWHLTTKDVTVIA